MTTPENPDWKKVSDELPEYRRNQALVLIKTAGENISIRNVFLQRQPADIRFLRKQHHISSHGMGIRK